MAKSNRGRLARLYVDARLFMQLFHSSRKPVTYGISAHGLPDDAEIVNVRWDGRHIELLIWSEAFDEVSESESIPVLPPVEMTLIHRPELAT